MKAYKLGWRFWLAFGILTFAVVLGLRGTIMMVSGEITTFYGEPAGRAFWYVIAAILAIPLSTYLYSVIIMLRQIIRFRGTALTLTEEGIENTLTFIYVLAFVWVVPIRRIPWEAVKYYDPDPSGGKKRRAQYVRLRLSMVQASLLAKIILFIRGYMFCYTFCKPAVTEEDITPYRWRFSVPENDLTNI